MTCLKCQRDKYIHVFYCIRMIGAEVRFQNLRAQVARWRKKMPKQQPQPWCLVNCHRRPRPGREASGQATPMTRIRRIDADRMCRSRYSAGINGGQIWPAKQTRLNCTSSENLSILTDRLPACWKSVLRRRRLSGRTVQAAPATEIARLRKRACCPENGGGAETSLSEATGRLWLRWCLQGRIRLFFRPSWPASLREKESCLITSTVISETPNHAD
jgi:hypothetical protein